MGGKLSPAQRKALMAKMKAKKPGQMPSDAKPEPDRAPESSRQPVIPEPKPDLSTRDAELMNELKAEKDLGVLTARGREVCAEHGIKSPEELEERLPMFYLVLSGRQVVHHVFKGVQPAEPPEKISVPVRDSRPDSDPVSGNPPPSRRSIPPPPPIRTSNPPRSTSVPPQTSSSPAASLSEPPPLSAFARVQDQPRLAAPNSGAYDATNILSPSEQLNDQVNAIYVNRDLDAQGKYEAALNLLEEEKSKVQGVYTDLEDAIQKATAKPENERTGEEQYLFALHTLENTVVPNLKKIADKFTQEPEEEPAQAVDTPVPSRSRIDLPPQESEAPSSAPSAFWSFIAHPLTHSIGAVAAFSGVLYGTGRFPYLVEGVKRLAGVEPLILLDAPNQQPQQPGILPHVIYWGTFAVGLGISELIRRRVVRKEAQILKKRAEMGQKEKLAFTFAVTRIAEITSEDLDPKEQSDKLREAMIEDEDMFEAVDHFYKKEVLWRTLIAQAHVDGAVRREFATLKDQAEAEIIGKRLAKIISYIEDSDHRKMALQQVCSNDPLFRKKLEQLFQKENGNYKNRGMRERVSKIKYEANIAPALQEEFLKELEEDYVSLKQEGSITG